jgi:hypothetical protein
MMLENSIRQNGLQTILDKRLEKIQLESKRAIIPFSFVFHRLCSAFCITKKECWDLLFYLQDREVIEIVPFHGVRIN